MLIRIPIHFIGLLLFLTSCTGNASHSAQSQKLQPTDTTFIEYIIGLEDTTVQQQTLTVIEKRLTGYSIRHQLKPLSDGTLQLLIPTSQDSNLLDNKLLFQLIGKRGVLSFHEVYTDQYSLATAFQKAEAAISGSDKPIGKLTSKIQFVPSSPYTPITYLGIVSITDTAEVTPYLKHPQLRNVLPETLQLVYGITDTPNPQNWVYLYALKNTTPLIRNVDVSTAEVLSKEGQASRSSFPNTALLVTFTENGRQKFEQLTRQNINKPIAICIDNVVLSAPRVMDVITGGQVEISTSTDAESKFFYVLLNSGVLPNTLEVLSINKFPH